MSQQLGYKTYERGTRAQQVDTLYTGGMLYSNVPLAEQYCKALVNMDITKEGTIKSREGLRQKSATSTNGQITEETYKLIDCVTASAYRGEVEDQHCIVVAKNTYGTIPNTKLISKSSRAFMHTKEGNTFYGGTLIKIGKHFRLDTEPALGLHFHMALTGRMHIPLSWLIGGLIGVQWD